MQCATFRLVAQCLNNLRPSQTEYKTDSEPVTCKEQFSQELFSRRKTNVLRFLSYFYKVYQTLYEIHIQNLKVYIFCVILEK